MSLVMNKHLKNIYKLFSYSSRQNNFKNHLNILNNVEL